MSIAQPCDLDCICQDVPVCLRERPQWVVWKYIDRDGRQTKCPVNPNTGSLADSTDCSTWGTFEAALARRRGDPSLAGIGFVFSQSDPYCGIDLDHCLDPQRNFVWGQDVVDEFDCYAEVSPSGTGVKLFFQGHKPAFAGSVVRNLGPDRSGRLEIYDRDRFFAVTGEVLPGHPAEVPDRQEALESLCSEFWTQRRSPHQAPVAPAVTDDSDAVEARAIAYLAAMPEAISGQGGHSSTYAAATALVHGFGMEPERALQILWQHYNPRCKPPWSPKELEHKVQSAAAKGHRQPHGWLLSAGAADVGDVDLSAFDRILSEPRPVDQDQNPVPRSVKNGTLERDASTCKVQPLRYARLTCAELDEGQFALDYLIERTLVRGQPCLVAGPKKSLKTSIIVDMAISMATGLDFLGSLPVRTACRVAVMSGESGLATLQETARRVAESKGLALRDISGLIWSPDLPRFGKGEHWGALREFLTGDEIEALFVDPAYLSLPGADAGNLFIQGELFHGINQFCQEHGVTMVLAHHLRKNLVDAFRPPELEDIAWAGFQEWARQWMLIGRRERFEPGTGEHRLWLNVGGSAGHSALWSVDVSEGVFDGVTPRRWEVVVRRAEEARRDVALGREAAKEQSRRRRLDQDKEAIRVGVSRMAGCKGTKTDIRNRCGRNGQAFNVAFAELLDSGELVPCNIEKENGKSYAGFTFSEENNV